MARPRKFVEADVIAAARDQFWTAGYAGTSLDDLTKATGLGRGSLYGAFGDKHDLFLSALDDYSGVVMAGVSHELRETDGTAYQRLVRHIRNTVNADAADAQRGCLMAKSAAELGSTDDEVLHRVQRSMLRYQAELRAVIEDAQRDGDIADTADAGELALLVLTFLRGSEAVRKSGITAARMECVADQIIASLPRGG